MPSVPTARLFALAGSAAAIGLAGAAGAQTTAPAQTSPAEPQPGQAAPAQSPAAPSQEEVSAFAQAYVGIARVQQQAQAALQQAEPAQQPEIEQRMQQQMAATVAQAGLTPQRFNDIAQASRSDPELAEQIQRELQSAAR